MQKEVLQDYSLVCIANKVSIQYKYLQGDSLSREIEQKKDISKQDLTL
jgi:hypothetical protein